MMNSCRSSNTYSSDNRTRNIFYNHNRSNDIITLNDTSANTKTQENDPNNNLSYVNVA